MPNCSATTTGEERWQRARRESPIGLEIGDFLAKERDAILQSPLGQKSIREPPIVPPVREKQNAIIKLPGRIEQLPRFPPIGLCIGAEETVIFQSDTKNLVTIRRPSQPAYNRAFFGNRTLQIYHDNESESHYAEPAPHAQKSDSGNKKSGTQHRSHDQRQTPIDARQFETPIRLDAVLLGILNFVFRHYS